MQAIRAEEMKGASTGNALAPALPPEDQARADFYTLISHLFFTAPDADLLAALAEADSLASQQADNPLDAAWEKLILVADIMDADAVQDEFNELFISAGTPKINPYASLYLAGFLNEKPLAELRADLTRLGLARISGVHEMEDHLAALCEAMRLQIAGAAGGTSRGMQEQKLFFEKYLASWVERCFDDIRAEAATNFYGKAADFAQAFFAIEAQAFELEISGSSHL